MITTTAPYAKPGDVNGTARLAEMLRVNHAGEYGAKRIYAGQMAVLKHDPCHVQLAHMAQQEQEHLDVFDALLAARRVRPSLLLPFWHVAGYALGAGTALMGKRAAMACTVAVETVISEHYAQQIATLAEKETALKSTLEKFKAEEEEHHAIGLKNEAEQAPAYEALSALIRSGCRVAIKLAEKL